VRAGLIEVTPGEVTDYNYILQRIALLRQDFKIQEIVFDRWGAAKLRAFGPFHASGERRAAGNDLDAALAHWGLDAGAYEALRAALSKWLSSRRRTLCGSQSACWASTPAMR